MFGVYFQPFLSAAVQQQKIDLIENNLQKSIIHKNYLFFKYSIHYFQSKKNNYIKETLSICMIVTTTKKNKYFKCGIGRIKRTESEEMT
jgi:hypothetical protein